MTRAGSPVGAKYDSAVNRESAAEILAKRAQSATDHAHTPKAKTPTEAEAQEGGMGKAVNEWLFGTKRRQGVVQAAGKQAARTITNRIVRGLLGGILK